MAAVLLDTTVLIDVLRGEEGAVERLRRLHRIGDITYVCAINAEELARGLRPSEAEAAARLVAGLRAAPLGPAEGWRAGEWRREFERRGRRSCGRCTPGDGKPPRTSRCVIQRWSTGPSGRDHASEGSPRRLTGCVLDGPSEVDRFFGAETLTTLEGGAEGLFSQPRPTCLEVSVKYFSPSGCE